MLPPTVTDVHNYSTKQFPDKRDNYIAQEVVNTTCIRRSAFYKVKRAAALGPLMTSGKDRRETPCRNIGKK